MDTAAQTHAPDVAADTPSAEAALAVELAATRALHELSTVALEASDLTKVLEVALDATIALHRADFGNVQLYDPATATLRIAAQRGFSSAYLEHFARVDACEASACGLALSGRRRKIITDVETDPVYAPNRDAARAAGYRAVQSTPLLSASGELLGMLSTHFRVPRVFTESEERLTDLLAREIARVIERTRAQAALRESEEKYRTLFESMTQGYAFSEIVRDADGRAVDYRILDINPAFERLVGIPVADARGRTAREVIPLIEDWWIATWDRIVRRGEPERFEHEIAALGKWYEVHAYPRGGDRFAVIYDDITPRKAAERALRDAQRKALEEVERLVAERTAERDTLRRQLTEAEEAERRRLARELHDEVGQQLTALGLGLQALSDVAPPNSEVDRRAADLRERVGIMGRELHGVAVRLRPKVLDDFGLEAAVTAHAEEWSRRSGIAIDVHATVYADRLPDAVETAVYRVVQEALTNVARHSGASRAAVVLERREGQIVAVVEDDGRGFDVVAGTAEQRKGPAGLGLLGIRERVALLGGAIELESTPGGGTALFVRIPVADDGGAVGPDVPSESPQRPAPAG